MTEFFARPRRIPAGRDVVGELGATGYLLPRHVGTRAAGDEPWRTNRAEVIESASRLFLSAGVGTDRKQKEPRRCGEPTARNLPGHARAGTAGL